MTESTKPSGGNASKKTTARARRPYRKPVLRSTDAFEKFALQTCAESETPDDECPME
jgi:hypothetical protein